MDTGYVRTTNADGRHPLPARRLTPGDQQPRAAPAAPAAGPAPKPRPMVRQISTPYFNNAGPLPYGSDAEADKDREGAIAMVNSGRQSSKPGAKDEPLQRLPRTGDPPFPSSNGQPWSPRELEAANTLGGLRAQMEAAGTSTAHKASKELGARARVNTRVPLPCYQERPRNKRMGDRIESQEKRAKTGRVWKAEPQKGKSEKGKRILHCAICGDRFKRTDHLARHTKDKHDRVKDMYECDVCQKLHSRRDNVKPHRETHKEAGPAPESWRVFRVVVDEKGHEIGRRLIFGRRLKDEPAHWSVTADGGAQVDEGEAQVGDGEESQVDEEEAQVDNGEAQIGDREESQVDEEEAQVGDGEEAQVAEGEVDTVDSPAQPDQEVRHSESCNIRTTTETGTRFTPINRCKVRVYEVASKDGIL